MRIIVIHKKNIKNSLKKTLLHLNKNTIVSCKGRVEK